VSFLYITVSFSVNGVENLSEVLKRNGGDSTTALVDVFEYNGMKWMTFVITIAALFGLAAVILSSIMGQSRVMRALSLDGLLPPIFGELDEQTKVPVKGAWISTIIFALIASCLNLDVLCTIVSVGNLLSYVIVNGASIQMRMGLMPAKQSDGLKYYLTKGSPWCFMFLSLIHSSILANDGPSWL
jgi:basic amino acid/polyamine antiporter, APA family